MAPKLPAELGRWKQLSKSRFSIESPSFPCQRPLFQLAASQTTPTEVPCWACLNRPPCFSFMAIEIQFGRGKSVSGKLCPWRYLLALTEDQVSEYNGYQTCHWNKEPRVAHQAEAGHTWGKGHDAGCTHVRSRSAGSQQKGQVERAKPKDAIFLTSSLLPSPLAFH